MTRLGTIAGLLAVWWCALGGPAVANDDGEVVTLPHTIERVWQRGGDERAFRRLAPASGDLTLTEQGLEFVTRKRSETLSFDEMRVVSLGKMKGDVQDHE